MELIPGLWPSILGTGWGTSGGGWDSGAFTGLVPASPASLPVRSALRKAFLELDSRFLSGSASSGSTCASVVFVGHRLFAANVGDSRAVLCRGGGGVLEMTKDHKPTRPDEARRIREAGGFVLHKR